MITSDEIIKVLDDLCDKFGIVIDWSSQNILPYLQDLMSRYTNYELVTSIVYLIITSFILLGLVIVDKKIYLYFKLHDYECSSFYEEFLAYFTIMITIIYILFYIIFTFSQINNIITCLTIPEKIILEYLNNSITN